MELYICTRTNWQGSDWMPVDGPFDTHKEAESKVEEHKHYPNDDPRSAYAVHARVVSRTQLASWRLYPRGKYGDREIDLALELAYREAEQRRMNDEAREQHEVL